MKDVDVLINTGSVSIPLNKILDSIIKAGTIKLYIPSQYGLDLVNVDYLPGFMGVKTEHSDKARELGLYMQKYCGCVFSEEERYEKLINKNKKINDSYK